MKHGTCTHSVPLNSMHPRRSRLGLIEALTTGRGMKPERSRIRGVRASASLKLPGTTPDELIALGIRGVRASASLKQN